VLNHIGSSHWWMKDMPSADWLTHQGHFVATEHFRTPSPILTRRRRSRTTSPPAGSANTCRT
jgi:hypothetical protein